MKELAFFCSLWYNQTQRGGVNVIRSTKLISTVSAGILIFLTMSACSENKSHEDNAPSQFEISAPDSSSLPEKQENPWWEQAAFRVYVFDFQKMIRSVFLRTLIAAYCCVLPLLRNK